MFKKLRAALGSEPSRSTKQGGASLLWLIVGLGNPGREYADNRHNIGFMVADRLARDYEFAPWRAKFSAELAEGEIMGNRALLLKPQTYMNCSGQAVAQTARFYKIPASRIVVLHDELDLPLGRVRTKTGGGAAGHNGLKSIDADFGDKNYHRVRIGIGHPGEKARVSGHVLSDFSAAERHGVDLLVAGVARHFDLLLAGRENDFMTKISEETKGA
ncbi:MAG: aminoacyl-tRNA hydrolase [Rhodospirillales bacterium]|nr:aminoacyl-tRNA hydrolase [Alphaproteobacteria bacterium]MCB9986147.1 aminoacyl-tRNA hydrolase [Rhodospirillales bacterium]USO07294.1 MAG: aminoacyl-tRNA hydrolase [Rhodospirillales bacterium]